MKTIEVSLGVWWTCWRLLSLVNAAELRELTATVFKTYLVPCSESVAEAMAEAGPLYHESAGEIKSKPEAERRRSRTARSLVRACVGGVSAQRSLAATRGLAPEHEAVLKSYWESNVLKSAPVQLAAHVRHCRVKPCKIIEGKEGWILEGALEGALQLQKGVRKHGPAPRGTLEREGRASGAPSGTIQSTHG